jgi:hypothetical protein
MELMDQRFVVIAGWKMALLKVMGVQMPSFILISPRAAPP